MRFVAATLQGQQHPVDQMLRQSARTSGFGLRTERIEWWLCSGVGQRKSQSEIAQLDGRFVL